MQKISTIIGMCILSIIMLATTLVSSSAYAEGAVSSTTNSGSSPYWTDQIVSDTVAMMMKKNHVPGMAVALYVDGKPYLFHYGYANTFNGQPVSSNTIFEMGSITKTFTSLLLSMEIVDGKMHLRDNVVRYASTLEGVTGSVNEITLEQLATHTSSLPFELPDYISTEQAFCNYLNRWHPVRPIGSAWQYSNIGFGLLGYMLEGATGQSYDELLHQRILYPLGMSHTAIDVPGDQQINYAQGYNADGAPAKQWRHNDIIPAEGSLKTTSQDMLKYLMASLGVSGTPADILSAQRLACTSFISTRFGLQGLAWEKHPLTTLDNVGYVNRTRVLYIRNSKVNFVSPDDFTLQNDNMLVDKTGNTGGFTSYIALIPSHKMGIVLLANRAALREQLGLAGRIILLNLMRGEPAMPTPQPVTPVMNVMVNNQNAAISSTIAAQQPVNNPQINNPQSNYPVNNKFQINNPVINFAGSNNINGSATVQPAIHTTAVANNTQQNAINAQNNINPPVVNSTVTEVHKSVHVSTIKRNKKYSHHHVVHKKVVHKSTAHKKVVVHKTVAHHHVVHKKVIVHKSTTKKKVAVTSTNN